MKISETEREGEREREREEEEEEEDSLKHCSGQTREFAPQMQNFSTMFSSSSAAENDLAQEDGIPRLSVSLFLSFSVTNDGVQSTNHLQEGDRTCAAEKLADMVRERDVGILGGYGGIGGLVRQLSTSLDNGMPDDSLQIQKRREELGANIYPGQSPKSFFSFLAEAFQVRAFFYFIVWAVHSLPSGIGSHGAYELVAIAFLAILASLVTSFTYYRQGLQCVLNKNEEKQNILVSVARGGRGIRIPICDLVVGDIVFLELGDEAPADGLFVDDGCLWVDESTVTGESGLIPVNEEMPFLRSGCKVNEGSGKMLVTGVGIKTERGRSMAEAKEEAREETPLQEGINGYTGFVNLIVLAGATLVLLILFISNFFGHKEDSNNSGSYAAGHLKVLTSIVVGVVARGPFLAISLSLTYAVKRMMVDRVLVRRLSACETMGCATTICILKKGLLNVEREAVHRIQEAGVKLRIITSDDLATANALAADLGISQAGIAIKGSTFDGYSAEMKRQELPRIAVVAACSPPQSLLFVRNLRESGEVVAVIGDNMSALSEADVGLSMGRTEAVKESSGIIILDDDFESVVNVVRWGRSVYLNIQKFIQFQLTVNVAALSVNFITAVSVGDVPLTAVQLLWVNLVMDTLGALALATESPTDEVLQRPPVQHEDPLVSNVMIRNLVVQAVFQVIIFLTLQFRGSAILGLEGPDATNIGSTIVFNAFVLCQLFNMVNARKPEDWNILKGLFGNIRFVGITCITLALQIIVVEFLSEFASTVKLSWQHWLICIAIGFSTWPVALLGKLITVPEKSVCNERVGPICRRISHANETWQGLQTTMTALGMPADT